IEQPGLVANQLPHRRPAALPTLDAIAHDGAPAPQRFENLIARDGMLLLVALQKDIRKIASGSELFEVGKAFDHRRKNVNHPAVYSRTLPVKCARVAANDRSADREREERDCAAARGPRATYHL